MAKSQTTFEELGDDDPKDGKPAGSSRRSSTRSKKRPSERSEKDLHARLAGMFDRLAGTLDERGDEELAEVIRDDGPVMAQGLVSLTRPFTVLRALVLGVVAVIEPVLAFGRVARVLVTRWADRRARLAAAREEAPPEA